MKRAGAVFALALLPLAAHADLAHRRNAVTDVVAKVSPAVVFVGTTQVVETPFRSNDPFFDSFFGNRFGPERREVQSLGSGVIVDANGTIVTNEHVIHGASQIHIGLADGRTLEADVVGSDADNDLAVLHVSNKGGPLAAATLGGSSDLMIGETVIAIGSPFGLQKTVTVGVLSATGRSVKTQGRVYNDFLQTDASINPGNSGGPLLNVDGEVVGINTAIYAEGRGIGFAIPADKVKRIVAELSRFGKVRPAWVGIDAERLTPATAARLHWERNYGVLVRSIETGSPADKAGVKPGDLVMDVGGSPVADDEDFDARMRSYPAKSSVTITVQRDGKPISTTLITVELPATLAAALGWDRLGISVEARAGALMIAKVRQNSAAARAGLERGDLLLRVNNEPVATDAELTETFVSARSAKSVVLLVKRGRFLYNLALPFERGS